MKKKLPIGIQTFRDIRDKSENYVYIDKTNIALDLIQSGRYYFLSRPRRFGKSLFLDTLSEIFQGHKELFEGLAIYDKWDWNQQFPVIRISFAVGKFTSGKAVEFIIRSILHENCKRLNLTLPTEDMVQSGIYFKQIIALLYVQYKTKVVILIDEYDKPILDNIHLDDKTPASEARAVLREFYSAIKDSDEYIRFVLITGVSKFSKLNLFSGLNNLTDITVQSKYATITGYTHADVEHEFSEYLQGVNMEKVRLWYNGYNFLGEPVYNPYDILQFIDNDCKYLNYWWQTGNPQFLIELLKKGEYYLPELENMEVSPETLNAFDVESIDIVALLWQTGYLTFREEIEIAGRISYLMRVPNIEVQSSLNFLFLDYLTNMKSRQTKEQNQIARSILSMDLQGLETSLRRLFASISHHNYDGSPIARYEGYYASVVFTFLASLGFDVIAEDTTNVGRIDMTLKAENAVYIFEFKVDMPAEAAIQQIRTKKYYEKYLSEGKPVYMIGIQFSSTERNITEFEWEVVG